MLISNRCISGLMSNLIKKSDQQGDRVLLSNLYSVPNRKLSSETGLKIAEMFPNRIRSLTAVTKSIIDFP